MQLDKYNIDDHNNRLLSEHKLKLDFISEECQLAARYYSKAERFPGSHSQLGAGYRRYTLRPFFGRRRTA